MSYIKTIQIVQEITMSKLNKNGQDILQEIRQKWFAEVGIYNPNDNNLSLSLASNDQIQSIKRMIEYDLCA